MTALGFSVTCSQGSETPSGGRVLLLPPSVIKIHFPPHCLHLIKQRERQAPESRTAEEQKERQFCSTQALLPFRFLCAMGSVSFQLQQITPVALGPPGPCCRQQHTAALGLVWTERWLRIHWYSWCRILLSSKYWWYRHPRGSGGEELGGRERNQDPVLMQWVGAGWDRCPVLQQDITTPTGTILLYFWL